VSSELRRQGTASTVRHRQGDVADVSVEAVGMEAHPLATGTCTTGSAAAAVAERATDVGEEYGRLHAGEGMLLVRITPEKVISENNITGEQQRAMIMTTGRR
jgi:hypothetical protein